MELNELIQAAKNCPVKIINKIDDTYVPGWGNTEEYKVVHYTGVHAPKFAGIEGSPGRRGCGAKYSVDWDGNMYQHCSKGAVVWAVGTAGYYTQKHPYANNRNCESVELATKCDDPARRQDAGPEWYIPDKTLVSGVALMAHLLKRDGQGIDHLLRHYDVVNKTCPAPFVHHPERWEMFRNAVAALLEDAPEPTNVVQIGTGYHGLVTTDNLNVRTSPHGSVIKTIPAGTSTHPVERTAGDIWFKNKDGWFSSKFVTGWVCDPDSQWWYLDNGQTAIGWRFINNKWYYFDRNGWMQTGWQYLGGQWYYLNEDGVMQTGWQEVDGKWYFMDTDGHMLHDQWAYNRASKIYYWLKSNGEWDGKTIQDPDQWESTSY